MDFMIDENKLDSVVGEFLDQYFKNIEIKYIHPYSIYTNDYGIDVEGENPYVIDYYIGNYDEDKLLFRVYLEDYWSKKTEAGKKRIEQSPILTLMDENLENNLDGMFNNLWENGIRVWFESKFGIKIKRVR
jgi:hypothetical protein